MGLRAKATGLDYETRKQAVDTIAFTNDQRAADLMGDLAANGPEDLRDYARWWLQFRANNLWQTFGIKPVPVKKAVVVNGITLPQPAAYVSEVIRKGKIADIEVDLTGATKLYLVVTDAGDGISCDWANWIEPRLLNAEGKATPLTSLKWTHATTGWGEVGVNRNAGKLPLKVDGRAVSSGIGTHASSVIVYDLAGKGSTRFLCRGGLDNGRVDLGGTDYPGGNPSVRFEVYHDGPSPAERALALQVTLLDVNATQAAREAAAIAMCRSAAGGKQLLALATQNKIPSAFQDTIAGNIHSNPDLMVRTLAGRHFPRTAPGTGQQVPTMLDLAKLTGDAARGRKLFHERAACVTCHAYAGKGGAIGPDLTTIGAKFDAPAILDALLNPSASITFGYELTVVTLKSGEVVSGFVVGSGDPMLVSEISTSRQRAIKASDIASTEQMKTSLMPS
ncbi:MAG: c-type cytochrome, partial [bacterium]|nr:c-type cytochrome [bacterium]